MFNLLNDKSEKNFIKIGALLVHAAKIDENFTEKEKELISKTLVNLGVSEDDIEEIVNNSIKLDEETNQILEFTKEVKNLDKKEKEIILETLWSIIYSDGNSDIYENNLMRRLTGLLYLDKKSVGDIKEKVKSRIKK